MDQREQAGDARAKAFFFRAPFHMLLLRHAKLLERLQAAFNAAANQNTEFDAQQELTKQVQRELPVIRDAVLEPTLLRAMALGPNLVAEPQLADAWRGRCKGSRAWDPRKDFSQCMQQPNTFNVQRHLTSQKVAQAHNRFEPSAAD